jgi:hypothetical protein
VDEQCGGNKRRALEPRHAADMEQRRNEPFGRARYSGTFADSRVDGRTT